MSALLNEQRLELAAVSALDAEVDAWRRIDQDQPNRKFILHAWLFDSWEFQKHDRAVSFSLALTVIPNRTSSPDCEPKAFV